MHKLPKDSLMAIRIVRERRGKAEMKFWRGIHGGAAPDCGGPSLVGRTFLSASGRRVRGVLTPPSRPEEMRKGQECPCGERADRNVCPTKSPQTRVTPGTSPAAAFILWPPLSCRLAGL